MNQWNRFLWWGLCLTMISPPFAAYGEPFSLEEVYQRVLKKNEEIQIQREAIRFAEESRKKAGSTILPKLKIRGEYDHSPKELGASGGSFILQPEHSFEGRITLEQPVYAGGKSWAGIRIAKKEMKVAEKELNLSIESSLFRASSSFYEVLKAQKGLEAQKRNVERLQEHRRLSDLRFKVGEVTESVLLRAEAEMAGAQAELVALEKDLMTFQRELQTLADLPHDFILAEPPLPEIPADQGSALLELAMEKREDVERSRTQESISQDRVAFARGSFLPKLSLEGTYWYRGQDPESTFFIRDSWVVGARMEIPLYEGGLRKAELAQARSQSEQARLESARLKREIDIEVTRAFLTLQATTRELESREKQVKFAQKNYEMVSKQFTFGLVTNVDLLDANQTLIEAERDVITTIYDRHLSILSLQRSVGLFLPSALEETQTNM